MSTSGQTGGKFYVGTNQNIMGDANCGANCGIAAEFAAAAAASHKIEKRDDTVCRYVVEKELDSLNSIYLLEEVFKL
jgi:hypothetical protein